MKYKSKTKVIKQKVISPSPVQDIGRAQYIKRCIGKGKHSPESTKECETMFQNAQKRPKKKI